MEEEEEGIGEKEGRRQSKDNKIDKEGRILMGVIKEREWLVLNGNVKGDEEEKYTFMGGRGGMVIDLMLGE